MYSRATAFLREKGLIAEDCKEFIIKHPVLGETNLAVLLHEYNEQRVTAIVNSYDDLFAWKNNYPTGNIYNFINSAKMEQELTDAIGKVIAAITKEYLLEEQ